MLRDPDNERKYGVKMKDAIAAAHARKSKIFDGFIFYMTAKVPSDANTLKTIIQASGGVLQRQTPTLRLIQNGNNRYVISCMEDISIWRNMAENGIEIYTPEFVLMGVLTQKLDYEKYRVMGSRLK